MKMTLLGLVAVVGMVACEPSTMHRGSDPAARVALVREQLKTIYMEDRIDVHYDGGDIGTYLSQFVWSDAAIVLAQDRGIEPFLAFFDSLRAAALNQNLTKHSPINNTEIPAIFRSAFPDRKLSIKTQFGDIMNAPLSVDRFYKILESYRDRASANQQGEHDGGLNGVQP